MKPCLELLAAIRHNDVYSLGIITVLLTMRRNVTVADDLKVHCKVDFFRAVHESRYTAV